MHIFQQFQFCLLLLRYSLLNGTFVSEEVVRPKDKIGDSHDCYFGYEPPDPTETEERDSDAGESEAENECDPSSENEEACLDCSV